MSTSTLRYSVPDADQVALVGHDVDQLELAEAGRSPASYDLALLQPHFDRHADVVAALEAEAEHRVGDGPVLVERDHDEIDRLELRQVVRLVVVVHEAVAVAEELALRTLWTWTFSPSKSACASSRCSAIHSRSLRGPSAFARSTGAAGVGFGFEG